MKKKTISLALFAAFCTVTTAQQTFDVHVTNKSKTDRKAVPVVLCLQKYGENVKSALVTLGGKEIPSQLDDLNGDGKYDELCFITDIDKKDKQTFSVTLSDTGKPREYTPQVYAEMLMSNKKIKSTNKQDLYISSLTVDNGTNPYWMLHHHGPAFENDMVAYRIYFDHRQTVDIYGKYHKGLELKQTQFYPDKEQKAAGFGDDVLWVGETFGLGTLRGWNGTEPQMLKDVDQRTLRLIARGPLRTIVEVIDKGWNTENAGKAKIDMTTRYTLYAGRRDCFVNIKFENEASGYTFATGIINVKNSQELTDNKGLRGCWGTDWPVSEKDSAGHKRETVGLGIRIPAKNVISELPADKDNYPFVIGNADKELHYNITFCSDNEQFGFHSSKEWFDYLKEWKKELDEPVEIK
ncbi:MAG: DUF4861 domain-containing protein [Prevotella sp.]